MSDEKLTEGNGDDEPSAAPQPPALDPLRDLPREKMYGDRQTAWKPPTDMPIYVPISGSDNPPFPRPKDFGLTPRPKTMTSHRSAARALGVASVAILFMTVGFYAGVTFSIVVIFAGVGTVVAERYFEKNAIARGETPRSKFNIGIRILATSGLIFVLSTTAAMVLFYFALRSWGNHKG